MPVLDNNVERRAAAGVAPATGIVPANRFTPVPDVMVRRRRISTVDWLHKELKEGGMLAEYLRREKGSGTARRLKIAARHRNDQFNRKCDLRPKLVLDARTFMRLRLMDPHFFEDEQNIKNLIRDNPEIAPWRK